MDVLLGTDVAELDSLLRKVEGQSWKGSLALVATTQSRARKEAEEEMHCVEKQASVQILWSKWKEACGT